MRKFLLWASLAGVGGVLAIVAVLAYLGYERLEGYYAPAFSPDGTSVYFVARQAEGFTWGLGFEHFTPPAHTYVLSDLLSLRRLDLVSGAVEVLKRWPQAPTVRRHLRAYRGRIFQILIARLAFAENGELEYTIGLGITRIPTSERYYLSRVWNEGRAVEQDTWQVGDKVAYGYAEDRVRGSRELITIRGTDFFPVAILLRDHTGGGDRILLKAPEFDALYAEGIPEPIIEADSQYQGITRTRNLRRTRDELVARFRAEGLSEGEALLGTSKELERLGLYPKRPTLTATRLDGAPPDDGVPLFEIAVPEMQSGIFPDIEAAIADPGTEVDKAWPGYVIHEAYTNSARLNAHLNAQPNAQGEAGNERFRVRYKGDLYELVIERP